MLVILRELLGRPTVATQLGLAGQEDIANPPSGWTVFCSTACLKNTKNYVFLSWYVENKKYHKFEMSNTRILRCSMNLENNVSVTEIRNNDNYNPPKTPDTIMGVADY